ncbi:LuxR C-terminal-related transcriptional regulator [Micromonospora sp. WMMA1363]|uniref:LuxR family transcriptional regulator n=1 Tax=Micromonospora sp. WMMA1363 TaxID=3053985 RepID=UPI00259C76F4|nr:LuxR family transcriptional regulator [Micromonospora sp. WMMA1363]MDM4719369.1 LuxR C-terminal-related transcriptional regulator [Micromonospora sp. WMMA1363]
MPKSSSRRNAPVVVREHLAGLSAAQTWLARVAAISTTPCESWFVERMVSRSGTDLCGDLEDLVVRGVLRDTGHGLSPSTEAVRDEVLRAAPPTLVSALRQRAADVLASAGLPALAAGQVLQAVRAGYPVDLELVSALADSPAIDPSVAADLLTAVLARPDARVEPGLCRAWTLATVDNLMLADRAAEALTVLTEKIAAGRDTAQHMALLHGRMGAWYAAERPSQALRYLRQALAQRQLPPDDRAWLLATAAGVASRVGHPEAPALLRRAQRARPTTPTPGSDVRLALARSAAALSRGDVPSATRAVGSVDPRSPHARSEAAALRVERIVVQLAAGEFDNARTALRLAVEEVGSLGAAVRPTLVALGCQLRLAVGQLSEAEAQARLALRDHSRRRLPDPVRADLLAVVAEVLFRQGRADRARELLNPENAGQDWPDDMPWLALRCAAAADPDPTRHPDLVLAAVTGLARSLRPLVLLPQQATRLVRAALAIGDLGQARTVERFAGTVAAQTASALWRGIERHTHGLIERDPAALAEAVSRLRATGARTALADALFDVARLPKTPPAEARAAVTESAALFGRLGATGDQKRAQHWETELGTARRRRRATAAQHGFAALTTREARVAELLATGATKRQAASLLYVSFHTVDTHLRGVYAKLGIRSRVELARLWANRESHTRAA